MLKHIAVEFKADIVSVLRPEKQHQHTVNQSLLVDKHIDASLNVGNPR